MPTLLIHHIFLMMCKAYLIWWRGFVYHLSNKLWLWFWFLLTECSHVNLVPLALMTKLLFTFGKRNQCNRTLKTHSLSTNYEHPYPQVVHLLPDPAPTWPSWELFGFCSTVRAVHCHQWNRFWSHLICIHLFGICRLGIWLFI